MGHCTQSFFFLLGWNLLCCDATVSVSLINSANEGDVLECGSDGGIVSCRINPYASVLSWEIDGRTFAFCAPGCSENEHFTRNYSPTYDVVNGIFNLTVDDATFDDNSTIFKCNDGYSIDSITLIVVPAYSENNTNMYETDEGKQVEFTTACVQPGVEFDWFTVKTDNSSRTTYNNGQNEMTETTECSLNLACGGVGTGKVSSKIMIPIVSDGKERYLEVVVKYKNPDEERTFRFDEIFHFKDEGSGLAMWQWCYVVVIVSVCIWVALLICVVLYLRRMKRNQANLTMFNNNRNKGPREMPLHENKMSEKATSAAVKMERANPKHSQNKDIKKYYDTSEKRGLLLLVQLENTEDWKTGNINDFNVMTEFFQNTLGFEFWIFKTYFDLDKKLRTSNVDAKDYYCLVICISGHGNEKGVVVKTEWTSNEDIAENPKRQIRWKTIDEIKKRFSNETISTLSGVPKIIILDTCRGDKYNKTVHYRRLGEQRRLIVQTHEDDHLPTTDSDLLLINATTQGHVASIPDKGSVGIQCVMKALNANWKNDHLEEMLIDARAEVAEYKGRSGNNEEVRQTLETQSTLTKRLMFVEKKDVPQPKSTEGKKRVF